VTSLFRGVAAPLSTAAVVNALFFSSFGYSSRLWDQAFLETTTTVKKANGLDLQKKFFCGSFVGFVQALVICPMVSFYVYYFSRACVNSPESV